MLRPNLKSFPLSPGVYLFKNSKNKVIYVGRATYLRKRIANYFSKENKVLPKAGSYFTKRTDPKTSQMVAEAKKLDFIKTENLIDAVILEANLIKKYWPEYNIKEKDNRSFIYIVIPKTDWPYPIVVRGQQLNKYMPQSAHIFGPYKSFALAKNLLLLLRKIFPWSTCRLNQRRPCFYSQIGLCPGKCSGAITTKEYNKIIKNLILLFKGEKNKVKKIIKKTNPSKLEFLDRIDDSILITASNHDESQAIGRIEGYDISHFAGRETVGAMVVFRDNEFDKTQYRLFKIREAKPNDDLAALEETVRRRLKHKEWEYPGLIMVDGGKTQIRTIEKVLVENKLSIPVVGIAKYEGDRLIFGAMQKPLKTLISLSFPQLLKVRNEAHRFANSLRKKLLKKRING